MTRVPANWTQNPAKTTPVVLYSSSSVTYNSTSTRYSGVDVTMDEFDKDPSAWTLVPKAAATWLANPDSDDAYYAYDSAARAYDSASRTYDGVTTGEQVISTKTPAAWSAA